MTELAFLSPGLVRRGDDFEPALASPLRRALAGVDPGLGLRDLSLTGKLVVRGDLDGVQSSLVRGEQLVRLAPARGLVFAPEVTADLRSRLRSRSRTVVDVSGGLAGLGLEGETLMRRLTDADLASLPAAAPFARVPAVMLRREGERFDVFFPQELGQYVAEVVLDAAQGFS
ncbi:MAG: hypothetical protein ACR2GT_00440 [Gaiellaceae bacterium]